MASSPESVVVHRGPYPEFTLTALLVGYGLGILIALSIGYAALILGFSIEGSELAAILGFGILRGLMGRSSIIENNINQTIASAVNGASSGMMFSIPALFILNRTDFNPIVLVFACIAGGILGIAFIIPLRKQMIDFERLTYPGGVAVATILKSPGAGLKKAYYLLAGLAISAMVHYLSQYYGYEDFHLGDLIGMPDYMNGVWYISLLTLGAAYIAGNGGFFLYCRRIYLLLGPGTDHVCDGFTTHTRNVRSCWSNNAGLFKIAAFPSRWNWYVNWWCDYGISSGFAANC